MLRVAARNITVVEVLQDIVEWDAVIKDIVEPVVVLLESSGDTFCENLRDPQGKGRYGNRTGVKAEYYDKVRLGIAQTVLLTRAAKARTDLHKPLYGWPQGPEVPTVVSQHTA